MESLLFNFKIRKSFLNSFLIFTFAFISAPLNLGGTVVPNFFALILIVLLVIKYYPSLEIFDKRYLAYSLLFFLFSIHITLHSELYVEKYKGLIQIMLSLSIFAVAMSVGIKRGLISERNIGLAILILLILSLVEIFVPGMHNLTDLVRHKIFHQHVYTNYERDIILSGHLRPTLFSSEPSHVTKMFFVLMTSYGILIRNYFWPKMIFLLLVGMYIFASPTILLSLILVFILRYYHKIFNFRKFGFLYMLLGGTLLIFLSFFLVQHLFTGLGERLSRTVAGSDGSFAMRIVFPYISVYDVFASKNYLGIGLSAKEYIEGISTLDGLDLDYTSMLGNNAFAHSLIYFGVMAILFYYLLLKYLAIKTGQAPFYFFILIFTFSNNIGGLETPRYWVFLSLMCLSAEMSRRNRLDDEKGDSFIEGRKLKVV